MKLFGRAIIASLIAANLYPAIAMANGGVSSLGLSDLESSPVNSNPGREVPEDFGQSKTAVEVEKYGLNGELSQLESDYINQKRHVLMRHLYEKQELDQLRSILSEQSRESSYDEILRTRAPFTPDEIREIRRLDLDTQRAENSPNHPVKFDIRTIDIDVDAPEPIELNVANGYASSIVFYDQSGAPWPIEGDIIGDKTSFGSKIISKDGHIAVFEITRLFAESNALINLDGLSVPIVIKLIGNDRKVDSRLSVRLPKFGPNSQTQPFVHDEFENASHNMISLLNGDKLPSAKRFELIGAPGEVTYSDGMIYIRTRANLISPPWKSSVISPTGYKVYELPPVTNLLFSVDGEMKEATIEKGFDVKLRQKNSIFTD